MVVYQSLLILKYTTLDREAFPRELIMIQDRSLTLSGLLYYYSDELNDIISRLHGLVG